MKNLKQLLLILSLVVLSNCTEEKKEFENSNIERLSFFNQSFDYFNHTTNTINLQNYNIDEDIISDDLILSYHDFDLALKKLNESFSFNLSNKNIIALVFYNNTYNSLIINNITGFSIIEENNSEYKLKTYKLVDNKLIKDKRLTKSKKGFTVDYFSFICHTLNSSNNSVITIRSLNKKNIQNKINDDFQTGIDYIALEQYPNILTKIKYYGDDGDTGHFCDTNDCSSGRGWCAWDDNAENIICQPSDYIEDTICPRDEVKINSDNFEENSLKKAAMYFIKDNLFGNSSKGSEYIDYYYKMGYVFKSAKLFKKNSQELGNFMNFIQDKAYLYVTSNSNTIIIDNSDYNYLISLLNKYENEVDNAEYKDIFNTFRTDLDFILNKTKADITNFFN